MMANPSMIESPMDAIPHGELLAQMEKFQVSATEIETWQQQLGLSLPTDPQTGHRLYSPHHVNLFKNIKKHIALGRDFSEIQALVQVPDMAQAQRPVGTSVSTAMVKKSANVVSTPESVKLQSVARNGVSTLGLGATEASSLTTLLERTLQEKDDIQSRLLETEKLNSHLYNANNLYHRKVRQLTDKLAEFDHHEQRHFKLMDDKSKLQAQVLEAEKQCAELRQKLQQTENAMQRLQDDTQTKVDSLQRQVKYLQSELNPSGGPAEAMDVNLMPGELFCGDWTEEATLMEVRFDHYGIELDANRTRPFRMSSKPSERIGNMAKVVTTYAYQNNASWQRVETLLLAPSGPDVLEGVLDMTFVMDGKAMANAMYKVVSRRA